MRYHIDTIPVWDAVKLQGECPLCALRRKTEQTDVARYLGGSVMEPDVRIKVNDKGFCPRHQILLYQQKNRLGHALMMQSHLAQKHREATLALTEAANAASGKGGGLFKHAPGGKEGVRAAAEKLRNMNSGCILCDSIEENLRRYAFTLLHLYKTDASFQTAFQASRGVCLSDAALLMEMAAEEMSGETLSSFLHVLQELTEKKLSTLETDLKGFTEKFDYRNADKPWGESRGSLERTVNALRGWCLGEEPNPK